MMSYLHSLGRITRVENYCHEINIIKRKYLLKISYHGKIFPQIVAVIRVIGKVSSSQGHFLRFLNFVFVIYFIYLFT